MYTLGVRERNLLRFNPKWWAIAQYPSLAKQLLETREQEALLFAQEIVAEIIQPEMSDRDKVDAILNFFSDFDANFDTSYYYSLVGGVDTRQRIDGALLERDANITGWVNTYKLMYSLAGLDVYPIYGTEVYEMSIKDTNLLKVPVNIDGEWEFIYMVL